MQGPGKAGITAYVQGWADLAGGIAPLLLQMAALKDSMLVTKAVQLVQAAATGIATAAQWAWNVAMTANPIGLIIAAIVLLVGAIILIATKTTWFQTAWKVAWGAIKDAAEAVWNWLKQIPGWLEDAFKRIAGAVSAPFKAGFNLIADAWNNTVGRLSWSVPSWVPIIGGNSISVPKLPHFHSGGVVPDVPGGEMLAVLQSGERVIPAGRGSGAGVTVRFAGDTEQGLAVVIQRLINQGRIRLEVG